MSAEITQHILKHFTLDLDPQWAESSAEIPDILPVGTSLFNQPPFYDALTSTNIFPTDIFANHADFGKVLLLNIFMRDWHESDHALISNLSAGMRRDDRLELWNKCILKGIKTDQLALDICEKLSQYFAHYPHIRRYFIEQVALQRFDTWGQPAHTDELTENYSSSGWMRYHKWLADEAWKTDGIVGVENEVKGFSTSDDIHAALPAKGKMNRWRRYDTSDAAN